MWDGTNWVDTDAVTLDASGGDDRTDVNVAYEQQSSEAMVVYGRTGTGLRHRTWTGTWSNDASLVAAHRRHRQRALDDGRRRPEE